MLLFLTINNTKVVDVRFTDNAPKIDGVIDDVWREADSAYDFVQYVPYEKAPPTEKTVGYALQDAENIYFAFKCYAQNQKPIANPVGDEDYVVVKIDPFGSKTTAYYFCVFASEIMWDGWLHDDGRTQDDSWEGVWFRGVKLHDDHYNVEIKIPYKSIRYGHGLNSWGIQFKRHIPFIAEDDYWTEVLQTEGDLISKWGMLTNVNPRVVGYHFELFPEGYIRYDRDYLEYANSLKPSLSLNLKWDLTSRTTFNATVLPDFAHIESDPFTLNLDQYPVYLEERRPFFLEGADILHMSDFGSGNRIFEPLKVFHSRRIGKSIDGDAVPIVAGLKLTNKSSRWNMSILGVRTSSYIEDSIVIEPARWFGALRVKHRVFENSDLGVLLSGCTIDHNNYNMAVGLDGVYRKGANQFIVQAAGSDKSGKKGWALSSGYLGDIGIFRTIGAVEAVHDSFDVRDIGFVPWPGRKKLTLYTGPYFGFPSGPIRILYVGGGVRMVKEPGQGDWSKLGALLLEQRLRNTWAAILQLCVGPYYEADTNYLRREISLSFSGDVMGYTLLLYSNFCYAYNYWRHFLAYRSYTSFSYNFSVTPLINPGINTQLWIEWDTLGSIAGVTPQARPNIIFHFNAETRLEVFSELVFNMPRGEFDDAILYSNRFGFLFSWRFKPKSWLYIALNDYRKQNERGSLQPEYRIGAVKVKYLFSF